MYRSCFALLFLLLLPATCLSWPAKVVSISDGDTITVIHNGRQEKIRLYGIDAPEKNQDYGQQAKSITGSLIAGRQVDVQTVTTDHYGRTVGLVTVDGQSLNELIVQNGYAWVYRQYCKEKFCSDWLRLEASARQQKRGLWANSVAIPPWEWRAALRGNKQSEPQLDTKPPVIIIGEKQNTVPDESLLTKLKNAFKPSNSPGESGSTNRYKCDGRTRCSQMRSCAEAKWFLENCPGTKMDGDHDGVPCEKQWCR